MTDSTYEVYTYCSNCAEHKKNKIPKGSKIDQTKCPNCGNMTLELDPNGNLLDESFQHPSYE